MEGAPWQNYPQIFYGLNKRIKKNSLHNNVMIACIRANVNGSCREGGVLNLCKSVCVWVVVAHLRRFNGLRWFSGHSWGSSNHQDWCSGLI